MKKLLLALSTILLFSQASLASSLPNAEISQKLGIGTGPSISVDVKLGSQTSLGLALGSPIYRGIFTSGIYDVRLTQNFINQGKFNLSGLIGVTGNPAFNTNYVGSLFGGELGLALSYKFLPALTGRLNIVGGFPIDNFGNFSRNYYNFVAPSSGIELGYKFTSNIEGTIGGNGQGDFLGLNFYF